MAFIPPVTTRERQHALAIVATAGAQGMRISQASAALEARGYSPSRSRLILRHALDRAHLRTDCHFRLHLCATSAHQRLNQALGRAA